MADQYHGVGTGGKELLQPLNGLDVQVIGRLVQQEYIGLHQKEFGQLDAHAPASGELAGGTVKILAAEAQTLQGALQFALVIIAPHQGEAVILSRKTVNQLLIAVGVVVRTLGHFVLQGGQMRLQVMDVGKSGLCLLTHCTGVRQLHHLRQIADGTITRQTDRTRRGRLLAGQYLEQSGLSGTVFPYEGDAVLLVDNETHVLKQRRGIELYGKSVY